MDNAKRFGIIKEGSFECSACKRPVSRYSSTGFRGRRYCEECMDIVADQERDRMKDDRLEREEMERERDLEGYGDEGLG